MFIVIHGSDFLFLGLNIVLNCTKYDILQYLIKYTAIFYELFGINSCLEKLFEITKRVFRLFVLSALSAGFQGFDRLIHPPPAAASQLSHPTRR